MEFNKDQWIEIRQGEYGRLKREDSKGFHSYTCRICHKYYKREWNLLSRLGYDSRHSGNFFFTDVEKLLVRLIVEIENIHASNSTWTPAMNKIIDKINALYGKKLNEKGSWDYEEMKQKHSQNSEKQNG